MIILEPTNNTQDPGAGQQPDPTMPQTPPSAPVEPETPTEPQTPVGDTQGTPSGGDQGQVPTGNTPTPGGDQPTGSGDKNPSGQY